MAIIFTLILGWFCSSYYPGPIAAGIGWFCKISLGIIVVHYLWERWKAGSMSAEEKAWARKRKAERRLQKRMKRKERL